MNDRTLWIETLEATPRVFRDAFERAADSVARPPAPDEWSVLETWAHVRASDAIIRPRITQILVRPGVTLPGFDERAWAGVAARAALPPQDQLVAFAIVRTETAGILRSLAEGEWLTAGRHEERGEMTIAAVVRHLAEHERDHHDQLVATLAAVAGSA